MVYFATSYHQWCLFSRFHPNQGVSNFDKLVPFVGLHILLVPCWMKIPDRCGHLLTETTGNHGDPWVPENTRRSLQCSNLFSSGPHPITVCGWITSKLVCLIFSECVPLLSSHACKCKRRSPSIWVPILSSHVCKCKRRSPRTTSRICASAREDLLA